MTPSKERDVLRELRARTPHERRQIEAGLWHAVDIAKDVGLDLGETHELLRLVRALLDERALARLEPRDLTRRRRFADHE